MYKLFLFIGICFTISACRKDKQAESSEGFKITEIPSPVNVGGEPNLFISENDEVYLSWIEYQDDTTDVLMFSTMEEEQWSAARKVSSGSDWFVNWADFPSIVKSNSGEDFLAAHWLQKSAEGTYDYDVRISYSSDNGETWSPSFVPHTDGIAAEHGFVTMIPLDNGRIMACWLDGRNTKSSEGHSDGHAHHGAMTIRAAEFDTTGNLYEEVELDNRVCDCCQTDAVLTDSGPLVIYRNRSEEEIRDIYIVRKEDKGWSEPMAVHQDHWKIAGCPVNGPAVDAIENTIAVAWFTNPDSSSHVNVVFSENAGKSFLDPIKVDDGNPLGRVDLVMISSDMAIVSWMEMTENGAAIHLAKVSKNGLIEWKQPVVQTSESRQSGFPILENFKGDLILAWTSVDKESTVKTAIIELVE